MTRSDQKRAVQTLKFEPEVGIRMIRVESNLVGANFALSKYVSLSPLLDNSSSPTTQQPLVVVVAASCNSRVQK